MGLFLDAAIAWNNLYDTCYILDVARKGKITQIKLIFLTEDFPHLAGMQYANDVDFGIRRTEYYGDRLIPALLNKQIDDSKIEKSRNWEQIAGRLNAITNLHNILDGEFSIYSFDKKKVRGYCQIDAKFIIKSKVSEKIYFVFFDEKSGYYYCKSAFQEENKNYVENQSSMTLLRKIKIENNISKILFLKQGYQSQKNLS